MAHPDMEASWAGGRLLGVAGRRQYLLVEMPHGLFVDLAETVRSLAAGGVRVILAHPERHKELLHEAGRIEQLIEAGCLVQVSSASVTRPRSRADGQALKDWFKRGVVHCLGSDGHSPTTRPPELAAAYRQVRAWAGSRVADRVGSAFGMAILQGLPLQIPKPEPRRRSWLAAWMR
jgi:protein-tyrosine phosphatase